MKLSDKTGIQHIILTCAALGLKEVIICPGSRNAPLVISFNRHPNFHCTSIRDERSAAFFALGKILSSGKPVAVLSTSGSAALNFAPAISEAYYQRLPLIVITADRPKQWTDQGDGQTIHQTDIYHHYIRASYDLKGDAVSPTDYWYNARCLSEGFAKATVSDCGPVHFNIPLSEPLYGISEAKPLLPKVFFETETKKGIPDSLMSALSEKFSSCRKVMIVAGQQLADSSFQKEVSMMAACENVVVLTESTSNLHDDYFVENIDRCITNMEGEEAEAFMPELLITLGGAVVSKRLKKLLRKYRPRDHWNVQPFDATMDTYQALTLAISENPASFFSQLRTEVEQPRSDYRDRWQVKKKEKADLHEAFCATAAYSDFTVFDRLFKTIPKDTYLHLSNSSPIRYAQLFDYKRPLHTWCNRGTSGIDGCTSTAMGAAAGTPEKNFLLITGDVAFHYDINALWNEMPVENLKIIVINNGGGGIFRIISGPGEVQEMKPYFETSMDTHLEAIAAHYNWDYLTAKDEKSLDKSLKEFFNRKSGRIIFEIFTDSEINPLVLAKYWQFLNNK